MNFFKLKVIVLDNYFSTKDNFEDNVKEKNIKQTISTLLENNIIPIINENDSVSTEEIQFGDNDQLSAILACHLNADKLIILTNTDGLIGKDNKIIQSLNKITQQELDLVNDDLSSKHSKGGMTSKLMAAKLANENGIEVAIGNGRTENIIQRLLDKQEIGTKIIPN